MATYQNLITQSMYDKQLDSGKGTLLHLCDDVIQQEVGPHSTLSAFLRTNKINTPSIPIYNLFDFFILSLTISSYYKNSKLLLILLWYRLAYNIL